VSRPDHSSPDVQRRDHHAIRLEPIEGEDGTDDVHDRIERADLVQVDALDRHLMNCRLRNRQRWNNAFARDLPSGVRADRSMWA
jgi:hypothetical protein